MPTYEYRCDQCGIVEEHIHRMSEFPDIKCKDCDIKMTRLISKNIAGFSIRGGSSSIHWREKRNRIKNSEYLKKKQKDKYGELKVQPNIAGVQVDSWSDAQKMAKEAGMDHESYTPYVEAEKKK